jgi:signal transduction histidine kinase
MATEKLVHNALKAMDPVGCLTVRTVQVGDQVQVEISDTGAGLPAHAREGFLRRRIQPIAAEKGSGMGALMARLVARRLGGDLTLVATGPTGTTLRLTLPIDHEPLAHGAQP